MTITVLLENTTHRADLQAEHGLSLYIEACGHRILFDMGQTDAFARNADTLGIDLSSVDVAILSHGHYDHGGGLPAFLARNPTAPVYVSRHAFGEHYNASSRYIGLDPTLVDHPRFCYTAGKTAMAEGLTLFAEAPIPSLCDLGSFGLTLGTGDTAIPDPFRHEQYLLVEEGGQRILISGCSHRGILNIVDYFRPHILIGGFHVSKMPLDNELMALAKRLSEYGTHFYTGHCTGLPQARFMAAHMDHLHTLSCGDCIRL